MRPEALLPLVPARSVATETKRNGNVADLHRVAFGRVRSCSGRARVELGSFAVVSRSYRGRILIAAQSHRGRIAVVSQSHPGCVRVGRRVASESQMVRWIRRGRVGSNDRSEHLFAALPHHFATTRVKR